MDNNIKPDFDIEISFNLLQEIHDHLICLSRGYEETRPTYARLADEVGKVIDRILYP